MNKNIITLLAVISISAGINGCGSNSQKEAKSVIVAVPATEPAFQKIDAVVGSGDVATKGQTVTVHYTGWLFDPSASNNKGEKFDSSVDRGKPFNFPLGAGRVIKGWDEGVAGMKIGGKRTLIIPSEMGYGARGAGSKIPPNATLLFDVELLNLK